MCDVEADTETGCLEGQGKAGEGWEVGGGGVSGCRFIWGKQAKDWGTIWKERAEEMWISQTGEGRRVRTGSSWEPWSWGW